MKENKQLHVVDIIRNFLFSVVNKQFLIFLFFLAFSGIFWLLMALNETYEREFSVELRMSNVPQNVVVTNDMPSTVRVTIRDKGYMILAYTYGDVLRPLWIDFPTYSNGKDYGLVPIPDLVKQLYQKLYKSSKVVSMKPDKVEFYYNFGTKKKFPVRVAGVIKPGGSYYLSYLRFTPDSVTVYGTPAVLDSIRAVYTTRQHITNFSDTMTVNATLAKIRGTKIVPDSVRMKLYPDVLTEETVEVPIEAVNMPEGTALRTFPSKVPVRFVVGANHLKNMPKNVTTKDLLPTGFRVVANYNTIIANPSDKCHLTLVATPERVHNARLDIAEVDNLIEK